MPENRKNLSHEEREAILNEKIRLQQQRIQRAERTLNMLGHRSSEEERRQRTRRLIQIGAVIDRWLDREGDPQILSEALALVVHDEKGRTLGKVLHACYQEALSRSKE